MVRKTNRNRKSFYWEYDCYEDGAREVRTWGDGGVLSLWIDYHDDEGYNTVRTGRKNPPSEYHYNEKMLCIRIVYPDLTETRETYNDYYQLVSQVDEKGRFTLYKYNSWSQITEITRADSAKIVFSYDDSGRLAETVNPEGGSRKWFYNDDDTLHKVVDEEGIETVYHYNGDRLVEKAAFAGIGQMRLEYDRYLNLSKATLPDGSSSVWEYDQSGNCLTARNALGAADAYRYDALNRMVEAKLADGNEIRLSYDGYEDVIHAEDKDTEVDFTYTILGSPASRVQDGRKIAYGYNNEEELISVTNEKEEAYLFERDANDRLKRITDELANGTAVFSYDEFSNLVCAKESGFDTIFRATDVVGNLAKKVEADGSTWTYDYFGNGMLKKVVRPDRSGVRFKIETGRASKV